MSEEKMKGKVVARRKGYALSSKGELWTTGPHAFMCGYVSDPENLDAAIDAHEEEMHHLMEEARVEFDG